MLLDHGIQISMDLSAPACRIRDADRCDAQAGGKGRALDNVFVERLWRSVKHEEVIPQEVIPQEVIPRDVIPRDVYLKGYATMKEVKAGLKEYFRFYNEERFHQGLDYRTPDEVDSI